MLAASTALGLLPFPVPGGACAIRQHSPHSCDSGAAAQPPAACWLSLCTAEPARLCEAGAGSADWLCCVISPTEDRSTRQPAAGTALLEAAADVSAAAAAGSASWLGRVNSDLTERGCGAACEHIAAGPCALLLLPEAAWRCRGGACTNTLSSSLLHIDVWRSGGKSRCKALAHLCWLSSTQLLTCSLRAKLSESGLHQGCSRSLDCPAQQAAQAVCTNACDAAGRPMQLAAHGGA